jgi:tetratricopeptide (TPR) repeat protein
MTTPNHRTAAAALDSARPLITRLDASRHPEDVAADLIEAWQSVETALRALLGGSALSGQALVGDVRQRGLLDYRHAHDLLGFMAARDRASRAGYRPDAADVDAARTGFQSLEAALGLGIGALTGVHQTVAPTAGGAPNAGYGSPPPVAPQPPRARSSAGPLGAPPAAAAPGLGAPAPDLAEPRPVRSRARGSRSVLAVAAVALAVVLAGVFWWVSSSRGPRSLDRGVAAYRNGQKDIARREFQAAAEADPTLAAPRVYLARMAREEGDLTRANAELQRAIQADPRNALAQREMGQLLLQGNRPDLATNFLRRAVEADNTDRVAMGWLACALARQGNAQLARSFGDRAGQGDWTGCLSAAPQVAYPPGALPPGAVPGQAPAAYPPGAYAPPAPAGTLRP